MGGPQGTTQLQRAKCLSSSNRNKHAQGPRRRAAWDQRFHGLTRERISADVVEIIQTLLRPVLVQPLRKAKADEFSPHADVQHGITLALTFAADAAKVFEPLRVIVPARLLAKVGAKKDAIVGDIGLRVGKRVE